MPPDGGPSDPQSALRGLFRSFVSSAEQGADTATVWANLRDAAQNFAQARANAMFGSAATDEQVAGIAGQLLSGITVQDVNNMRSLAGQYVRAHQNATSGTMTDQFDASDIFTAPWSKSATSGGSFREYRANITFRSTFHGFSPVEVSETRSFLIGPTLTNPEDMIAAAKTWYGKLPYNSRMSDTEVTDWAIEAV